MYAMYAMYAIIAVHAIFAGYAVYAVYAMSGNVLAVKVKRKVVDDDAGYSAAHDATTTPTGDCHLLLGYVCCVCCVCYEW